MVTGYGHPSTPPLPPFPVPTARILSRAGGVAVGKLRPGGAGRESGGGRTEAERLALQWVGSGRAKDAPPLAVHNRQKVIVGALLHKVGACHVGDAFAQCQDGRCLGVPGHQWCDRVVFQAAEGEGAERWLQKGVRVQQAANQTTGSRSVLPDSFCGAEWTLQ